MPDWQVMRYIPNAPNETTGAWVDEGTVIDLKATEAKAAIDLLATTPGRYRATRWDTTEEYDIVPGPPTSTKTTKKSRDKDETA